MERPERIWPEPEPPIGEEKARPPAFRRANRHCPQFKSSLIPLKTKGTKNSNSHSEHVSPMVSRLESSLTKHQSRPPNRLSRTI